MTEVKKKRTPKDPEAIFAAAERLSLVSKVALRDKLNELITEEVKSLKAASDYAEKIANGNK